MNRNPLAGCRQTASVGRPGGALIGAWCAAALAGCAVSPIDLGAIDTAKTGHIEQALGEAVDGRPAYPERLALYACNRARAEPATSTSTGWPSYPVQPPLLWADMLAQSARAHSEDMRDTPCFQHPSCDGTDTFVRIETYWTVPYKTLGENIAAGVTDGQIVISNWIDEIGAAPGETGHRDNMFSANYQYVGFGYAEGGTQYMGYWTQDFAGVAPAPVIPPLASGSHFASPSGSGTTFGTVYYSEVGTAPDKVTVVVDGTATALALVKGTASAGAYEGDATLAAGCHRYYFTASVGGKVSNYPDTGTLGVDPAGGTCADFVAGPVGGATAASDGGAIGRGNKGGGCRVGGGGESDLGLLGLPLALLLLRRRRALGLAGQPPASR